MEKINDAIKCGNCCSILNSPVLLPCGHSICKQHTQTWLIKSIRCGQCGIEHQIPKEGGFLENKSLALIISTQIHNINLGEAHEKAKTDFKGLESLIKKVNFILADPTYQIREEIDGTKNEILLKREQLKLEIDQETDILINRLDQCLKSTLANLNKKEFEECSSELGSIKIEATKKLEEFKKQFDQFSLDENKWKYISGELAKEHQKLSDILLRIRKPLIMPDLIDIQFHARLFVDFKLNFIRPDQINSNIINTGDLNRELFQVCEFQSCQRFELLYRGSEHNYNWSTFHAKCDNKSPTLVIVKSNDGCIFGGYTKAKWNGIEAWVADSQAFVFRLKTSNLESKKYKVNDKDAIYCDEAYGPCFGNYNDIEFDPEGHVSSTLNSDISYARGSDEDYSYGVPFENRSFTLSEVTEMEVFHQLTD